MASASDRHARAVRHVGITLSALALVMATGCERRDVSGPKDLALAQAASAEFRDGAGRSVGRASMSEVQGGVRIVLDVAGLPPGDKGFHVHSVGQCDSPAFASAKEHFNPLGREHGTANPQGAHAGDLPNLSVDASGRGHLDITTNLISLSPGPQSVFDADGSALILHAAPDDMRSDPAGNSGARLACAVIARR